MLDLRCRAESPQGNVHPGETAPARADHTLLLTVVSSVMAEMPTEPTSTGGRLGHRPQQTRTAVH